jgi:hypothetical protein
MGVGRWVAAGIAIPLASSCGGHTDGRDEPSAGGTGASSGSGGSPTTCSPGAQVSCPCERGAGTRTCAPHGAGFGPCECPPVSGAGGTFGAGGVGGAGGSGGSDPRYRCFARQDPNPDPGGTQTWHAECCAGIGICNTAAELPDRMSSLGKDECRSPSHARDPSPELLCTAKPPAAIPALNGAPFPTCHSSHEGTPVPIEGRCMPRCFARGDRSLEILGPADCPSDLGARLGLPSDQIACLPCYDPFTGAPTGACTQYEDEPVGPPAEPFRACGSYKGSPPLGHCVPAGLVPTPPLPAPWTVPQDVCGASELCVPDVKLDRPDGCFARCENTFGASVCLPLYITEQEGSPARALLSLLGQSTCADGEICFNCTDPIQHTETGACSL